MHVQSLGDVIVLVRQGRIGGVLQLLLVLRLLGNVDHHLRRLERHLLHEVQVRVAARSTQHTAIRTLG